MAHTRLAAYRNVAVTDATAVLVGAAPPALERVTAQSARLATGTAQDEVKDHVASLPKRRNR